MRLINGTITEVLDPNIFYSRLSFLESGKDALDIKSNLNQGKQHNGYKLPNIQNKFYTRSALIRNLIPLPAEGKVRALFAQDQMAISYDKPKIKKIMPGNLLPTSGKNSRDLQSHSTLNFQHQQSSIMPNGERNNYSTMTSQKPKKLLGNPSSHISIS